LVCRALFAGNGINLNHGGNIANKYLRISENIFQQFIKIRLTTNQTPYFQAFPTITSKEQIPRPQGNFQALGQAKRNGTKLSSVKNFPLSEGRKQSKEGRSNDSKHQ
jgi:hypothetical protein